MISKPGTLTLNVAQGQDFEALLTWRDADNDIVDLTGYSATFHARRRVSDADPVISLTTDDDGGITLGGAVENHIALRLDAVGTTALDPANYTYQLWLDDGRASEGIVRVSAC